VVFLIEMGATLTLRRNSSAPVRQLRTADRVGRPLSLDLADRMPAPQRMAVLVRLHPGMPVAAATYSEPMPGLELAAHLVAAAAKEPEALPAFLGRPSARIATAAYSVVRQAAARFNAATTPPALRAARAEIAASNAKKRRLARSNAAAEAAASAAKKIVLALV
jgi:hypothetical protein